MKKMKCYLIDDPNSYDVGQTTAFAENAAKARYVAKDDDALEQNSKTDWLYYHARRFPEGDCRYREGKTKLDWNDPEDRLILVRDAMWACESPDEDECAECRARKWCRHWEEEQ